MHTKNHPHRLPRPLPPGHEGVWRPAQKVRVNGTRRWLLPTGSHAIVLPVDAPCVSEAPDGTAVITGSMAEHHVGILHLASHTLTLRGRMAQVTVDSGWSDVPELEPVKGAVVGCPACDYTSTELLVGVPCPKCAREEGDLP